MSMSVVANPSLARRSAAWLYIAAMGNLGVVAAAFVAGISPVSIPPEAVFEFLYPFAAELYSPELLIFTSLISVLIAFGLSREGQGEVREAARLIAWTVRLGLTVVLTFAVVVVVSQPASLARVLFALLLGFITFVLAERLDSPAAATPDETVQRLTKNLLARETWASASLGAGWVAKGGKGVWFRFGALVLVPIIIQAVGGVVVAAIVKGPAFGFSQYWVLVPLVTGYGMFLYSFAWLAAADKADSPQARVWRGSAFAVMGVVANVAFAYVYFSSDLAVVGWLTLALSSVHGVGLLTQRPRIYGSVLTDTASWITDRHLAKLRTRSAVASAEAGADHPATVT